MRNVWLAALAGVGLAATALAALECGKSGDSETGGQTDGGGPTTDGSGGSVDTGDFGAGEGGDAGTAGDEVGVTPLPDASGASLDAGGKPQACTAGASGKPNIVTIMVDDLDQGSFDILLANGLLPNIQKNILGTGVGFTESYVANSLCCPSRATYLTGQYSHNCKTLTNNNGFGQFLPHQNDTIATHMKSAGYRTAYFGKYLNGYTDATYHAPGWDEWQALLEPSVYYMWGFTLVKSIDGAAATTVVYNGTCPTVGQACTGDSPMNYQVDVLANLGATFIDSAVTAGKQPFFLTLMPLAPHVEVLPGQKFNTISLSRQLRVRPPPRHLGVLRAKLANGTVDLYNPVSATFDIPNSTAPSFNEADISDKPGWLQNGPTGMGGWPLMSAQEIQYQRRQHLDRMESMLAVDDMVGTLYAKLDAKGVRSSTVVILTSDNGFSLGSHRLNNKMFPYDEDIRVPLLASCNAPAQGTDAHMISNIDLAETITDYAMMQWDQDGRSFRALLEGKAVTSWRTRVLVEHWFDPQGPIFNDLPDHALVRTGKDDANPLQKYIAYYGLTGQLNQTATPNEIEQYDFSTDPWEDDNSATADAGAAARAALGPKLQALRTCAGASCRTADSN
jgi:arylsulfatase A-like enzyme